MGRSVEWPLTGSLVGICSIQRQVPQRELSSLTRPALFTPNCDSGTGVAQDTEYLSSSTYYYADKEPGALSRVIWERKGVGHQVVRWWDDGGTNPIHPYIRAGILAALLMVSLYTILCIFCDYLACNYQQA